MWNLTLLPQPVCRQIQRTVCSSLSAPAVSQSPYLVRSQRFLQTFSNMPKTTVDIFEVVSKFDEIHLKRFRID
jgi:hypothetical protein